MVADTGLLVAFLHRNDAYHDWAVGVAEAPSRGALYDRAARVVGRFSGRRDSRDLSSKHDRHLDEAYG